MRAVKCMMASGNVVGSMVADCGKALMGSHISANGLTSYQRDSVCTGGQMAVGMRGIGVGI
jgi:hypothetical protein